MTSSPELDPSPVYATVARIPRGYVCAYGEIARLSGYPGRARWVGRLLSQLPGDTRLPWHRVVNAAGRVTCPRSTIALRRLAAEGVRLRDGKVDLSAHGWP
jgi:methylated-DNA-protein-cysteine methyltransferase-like protein